MESGFALASKSLDLVGYHSNDKIPMNILVTDIPRSITVELYFETPEWF